MAFFYYRAIAQTVLWNTVIPRDIKFNSHVARGKKELDDPIPVRAITTGPIK